jgi:uncharacterized protein YggE
MNYRLLSILLGVFMVAVVPLAFAASERTAVGRIAATADKPDECPMTEQATFSYTFSGTEQDSSKIRQLIDNKMNEVIVLAKQAGLEKFDLQSSNYSISVTNNGNGGSSYNFNSNMSFIIAPSSKGMDLVTLSTGKGIYPNINVNAYKQCSTFD